MKETDFYLMDLASRFPKNLDKYYLSYSGGRDSHFLLWFIREYLKREVVVVAVNTYMEHDEIRKRIYDNSDIVLLPEMKPFEIKEKFGIPCFSKEQDFFIDGYQRAILENREIPKSYKAKVEGTYRTRSISKKAREYVTSNGAHRITHRCCEYLKKKPFKKYEKETNKKAILGIRGSESALRKTQYQSCFSKNGKFHPLYDMSDEMLKAIEMQYNIEVPKIYDHVSRTGCMGCPYGSYKKECQKELMLVNGSKKKFIINYFKESYEVLGVETQELGGKE